MPASPSLIALPFSAEKFTQGIAPIRFLFCFASWDKKKIKDKKKILGRSGWLWTPGHPVSASQVLNCRYMPLCPVLCCTQNQTQGFSHTRQALCEPSYILCLKFEFLIFLPPPPKSWHYRDVSACQVYVVLETLPKFLHMLHKHSSCLLVPLISFLKN